MVTKPKTLAHARKHRVSLLVLGALIAFFAFWGWRDEVAPSFLKNMFSLGTLAAVIYPILVLPFLVILFSIAYIVRGFTKSRRTQSKTTGKGGTVWILKVAPWFLGAIALDRVFSDMTKQVGRDVVKTFLNEVSSDIKVSVNDQLVHDPNQIIAELKKIGPLTPHWSHATKRISITVMSRNDRLLVELGRDSTNDQEYWVFYPKYRYTSKNEIGRIITDIFDGY